MPKFEVGQAVRLVYLGWKGCEGTIESFSNSTVCKIRLTKVNANVRPTWPEGSSISWFIKRLEPLDDPSDFEMDEL